MFDGPGAFFIQYIPQGQAFQWHTSILWLNLIPDVAISFCFITLSFVIAYFVYRKPVTRFCWLFYICALFMFLAGVTHIISATNIWWGLYGLEALVKASTSVAAVAFTVSVFTYLKRALTIPSQQELQSAVETANQEHLRRMILEAEQKANAIFKFAIELLPTGFMIIDKDQKITVTNAALAQMFGYETSELVGHSLSELLQDDHLPHHNALVDKFMSDERTRRSMASGRVVRGKHKDGNSIAIEISLSSHMFEGEILAFATIANLDTIVSEQNLALETSNRIKRAVDATNDGLWEWNVQSNAVWYSARTVRMLGKDPETTVPQFEMWLEHIHPDDRELLQKALADHFNQRIKFDVIYRGFTFSGEYEWLHIRGDTIFDSAGRPLLMSGTITNINEIKSLQEKLADQTHFLDEILHKSLCGTYLIDLNRYETTFINAQFTEITGYTLEDLQASQQRNGLLPLYHPDEQETIAKHLEDVSKSNDPHGVAVEYRFHHKDGHWIWCYSRDSVYIRDDQGTPKLLLGSFFDISDLKEREIKINQLAKDFETTFEQAAVGIAHVSINGEWIKANQRLCSILGVSQEQLLTLNLDAVTQVADREIDVALRAELLEGKRPQYSVEKRFLRLGSEPFWVNLTVSSVTDDQGRNSHFIVVVEDISERKRVSQALAESNAQLERFAYSASHDLQEPLRKISAFSDSLERRLVGKLTDPDARYELNRICNAASRMREMIDNLLQLSRYTRHKIDREHINFFSAVAQAKDDLSNLIEEHQAKIQVNGEALLFVDKNGFQQVLRNLITNSIRYARPEIPAVVTMSVNESGDKHRILISDNGKGFNNCYAEQIFEPFKRLVGRETPGSGMGLALCRQIIAAHEGSITAESHINDTGATFIIELPKGKDA